MLSHTLLNSTNLIFQTNTFQFHRLSVAPTETSFLFVAGDHAVPCRNAYFYCSLQYIAVFDNLKPGEKKRQMNGGDNILSLLVGTGQQQAIFINILFVIILALCI